MREYTYEQAVKIADKDGIYAAVASMIEGGRGDWNEEDLEAAVSAWKAAMFELEPEIVGSNHPHLRVLSPKPTDSPAA